jgi:hypothetical protein
MKPMLFSIIKLIVYPLFRALFSVEHQGVQNVPEEGAVIIAGNHPSYLDPLLVALPIRRRVRFMAWDALFKIPLLGQQVINAMGAFPVDIRKGRILSVLLRALLLGAEIRARSCGELLLLIGDLAGNAARIGNAGGRSLFQFYLCPVAGGDLSKTDRRSDACVCRIGCMVERRAENTTVDLRRAVVRDDHLSANIHHDRL